MYKIIKIVLLFVFGTTFLVAQGSKLSLSPLESMNQMNHSTLPKAGISDELLKEIFPVGNVIDANNYYVGPNDVLSIQILPSDVVAIPVVITSECSIVHKNFGEIELKGFTLADVRNHLNEIVGGRKTNAKVIVSLVQPRKVLVNIKGNIVNPGVYIFPASYSVSTAIMYANQVQSSTVTPNDKDEQSAAIRFKELQKDREKSFSESGISEMSLYGNRNIRLVRENGASVVVDIERAVATNDSKYDPFIREKDEIFVPFEPNEYPTISVTGEILRPASVVYKTGDMASHLIKMGYGFTENADLNNIKVYDVAGNTTTLKVDSNVNLLSNDFTITPGSIIIVGAKPKIEKSNFGIVSVKGEVNNPNIYRIELGKTKLKDIIQMAGDFTQAAYLPLATISRRDNSQNDRISLRRKYSEFFQPSNMTQQDTMRINMEIDIKKPKVSSDFFACFIDNDEDYNLILQDGDVINIPKRPNRVNVFGQVKNPGFVDFSENQTMEWYLNKAGGYAASADIKRTRIIRGNNSVWEDGFEDSVFVYDGDEIFVPPHRDVPPELELQKWAAFAGIAGVTITFINVIFSIYKESKNK